MRERCSRRTLMRLHGHLFLGGSQVVNSTAAGQPAFPQPETYEAGPLDLLRPQAPGSLAPPLPDDTSGSWSAAALRHLMLVNGLDAGEALDVMAELYSMIPETDSHGHR